MTQYGLRSTWVWFLLLAAALCLSGMLRAQALPTAKGPGGHIDVGAGVSVYQQDYGKRYIGGTTFYADWFPHWRFGLEGEARFLNRNPSQDVTLRTYMIGVKAPIRPRPSAISPYVKMMVGAGHVELPFAYAKGDFLTYAPGGGLDLALGDYVTVRAADFEYQRWQDFPYGKLSPYGLTAGISLRLNHFHRYPDGSPRRWGIPR